MKSMRETNKARRDFLKTLGLGVGALTLGDPHWLYAQSEKTITIGTASNARPIYGLALYWASERILKPELGINLDEKIFKGFIPSFAAMVRGDVDLSYQTLPALTRAIKENFSVKGFLGYVEQFVFYMVSRPDIKSMDELVSTIKQRAGSDNKVKIASHSPSSQAHIAINEILQAKGIDPKKDVEIIFLSGTPRRLAALKAKSIDATVVSTSRAIQSAIEGDVSILAKMSDFAPQQSVIIWVAGEETLAKRSQDILEVTKALIRSYRQMYTEDLKALAAFAVKQKPYARIKPPEAVLEAVKAAREMKLWPADGGISDKSIESAQNFLVESGFMKQENVLPVDQLITTKFRDEALKELGPA